MTRLICAVALIAACLLFSRPAAAQEVEGGKTVENEKKDKKAARPQAPRPEPRPEDRNEAGREQGDSMDGGVIGREGKIAREPMPPPIVVLEPTLTPALPADSRVAAREDGFVIVVSGATGDRFVSLDRAGKSEALLFDPGQKVQQWWLSPDGTRIAWTAGGKLFSTPCGAKAMDDLGAAPAGDIAFSPDGKRLAFVRDGKAVVREAGGKEERSFGTAAGLVLGDAAVFSIDGKKLFALLSSGVAGEPDGIGTLELTGEAPVFTRAFEAAGAVLRRLRLSPDGASLAFVQASKAAGKGEALRLFMVASGDVKTIARAAGIEDPVFSASGSHMYFTGKGANAKWQSYEVGTEPDAAKGEYPLRRIADLEGRQILRPSPAGDGKTAWVVVTDGEGKGAQIGMVNLR